MKLPYYKIKLNKGSIIFAILLLISLTVRLLCMRVISFDMKFYLIPWYKELASKSWRLALKEQVGNYNVTYQMFIYVMTKLPGRIVYKYKILSCIFDYVMAWGVHRWLHELVDKKHAVIGFALALLLPTIWLNSAAWRQCDSMYVCFIIWSLYMLQKIG